MLLTGFFHLYGLMDPVYRSRSHRDSACPAIMLIMLYFLGLFLGYISQCHPPRKLAHGLKLAPKLHLALSFPERF